MPPRAYSPARAPTQPSPWAAARGELSGSRASRPLNRGGGPLEPSRAANRARRAERSSPASRPAEGGRAWVPLVILGIGLVVLLYSMQLGSVTTSGYDLQRLQMERNEWRQRNEQLVLELAKVQSIAWIEVEAVQRLGMRKADYVSYLELPTPTASAPAAAMATPPSSPPRPARPDLLALWRGLLTAVAPTGPGEAAR